MIKYSNQQRTVSGSLLILALLLFFQGTAAASGTDNGSIFGETELMFIGEDLYTVSIASRKSEPLQRAPAAVTVIQADELKKYRTLSEVLRRVPGFFIDRNELKERIYLRGIPDSFLVMMDGVPFSSDASTVDYPRGMDLSLDYVEKIEIVRGPGSALWGPDAFSGIINLVTKKGQQIQGFEIKGEVGSYDTRGTNFQAGFSKKGWDAFLFAAVSKSEGFEKDVAGDAQRNDDRFREIYGKLSYKDVLEISGRYSRYRDYYTGPDYFLEGTEHKPFSFIQATFNKSFENSALSLQAWYQYFDSLDEYEYSEISANDKLRQDQINRQYAVELKYDRTFFRNNFATFGASFRYNDGRTTNLKIYNFDYGIDLFPSYDNNLVSLYFQDKWKITDNLETTFGIRYDNHSEYSSVGSPRLGISYIFWEYFNLKLLYGRAFRTPSLLLLSDGSGELDPERIDSYETQLGFNYKNLFNIELNYFYNELDDLIEFDLLDSRYKNSRKEHIKGIEVSIAWKPLTSISLYANYSHLFGDRQKGASTTKLETPGEDPDELIESTLESFLNVSPDSIFNAGIDYSFLDHFRLSIEANYVDKRKLSVAYERELSSSSIISRPIFISPRRKLSSYVLYDLNFFITDFPLKNTEIALKIKNILDKKYHTRGVLGLVGEEGSSMYLTFRYRF